MTKDKKNDANIEYKFGDTSGKTSIITIDKDKTIGNNNDTNNNKAVIYRDTTNAAPASNENTNLIINNNGNIGGAITNPDSSSLPSDVQTSRGIILQGQTGENATGKINFTLNNSGSIAAGFFSRGGSAPISVRENASGNINNYGRIGGVNAIVVDGGTIDTLYNVRDIIDFGYNTNAIAIGETNGNSAINKIINEGNIQSNNEDPKDKPLIHAKGGTLGTIENRSSGKISSKGNSAIKVDSAATFNGGFTNAGTIEAKNDAVVFEGTTTINGFNNSGTITNKKIGNSDNIEAGSALKFSNTTANTTINGFTNTGTIESNSDAVVFSGTTTINASGVDAPGFNGAGGTITSTNGAGLKFSGDTAIGGGFTNGTIESKTDGIVFEGAADSSGNATPINVTINGDFETGAITSNGTGTTGGSALKFADTTNATINGALKVTGELTNSGQANNTDLSAIYLGKNTTINNGIIIADGGNLAKGLESYANVGANADGNHIVNQSGKEITINAFTLGEGGLQVQNIDKDESNKSTTTLKQDAKINLNVQDVLVSGSDDIDELITGVTNLDKAEYYIGDYRNDPNAIKYTYGEIKADLPLEVFGTYADQMIDASKTLHQTLISTLNSRSIFVDNIMSSSALNDGGMLSSNLVKTANTNSKQLRYAQVGNNSNITADIRDLQEKDKVSVFVLPYYNTTSADVLDTTENISTTAHAMGLLAGGHYSHSSGIYGLYVGYERNTIDSDAIYSPITLDINSIYFGLNYTKDVARLSNNIIFVKANINGSYNDIEGEINIKNASLATRATAKPTTNAFSYSAQVEVGDIYTPFKSTAIVPKLSLAYNGSHTKGFDARFDYLNFNTISPNSGINMNNTITNLFSAQASLKWHQEWFSVFGTAIEGGARYIFNPTIKYDSNIRFNGVQGDLVTTKYDVQSLYGYTQASLILALGDNANLSLSYNGIFADKLSSHTGFLRLNVVW